MRVDGWSQSDISIFNNHDDRVKIDVCTNNIKRLLFEVVERPMKKYL